MRHVSGPPASISATASKCIMATVLGNKFIWPCSTPDPAGLIRGSLSRRAISDGGGACVTAHRRLTAAAFLARQEWPPQSVVSVMCSSS